jgi:hypothetical protein
MNRVQTHNFSGDILFLNLVPYKYKTWLNIREGFSPYVNSDLPHLLHVEYE